MKKHVRQILYTSIALGVSLTTASVLEDSVSADTNVSPQTQQVQPTENGDVKTDTQSVDTNSNIDVNALNQEEGQKQVQYQKQYDQLSSQPSKTEKGFGYFVGQSLGDFSKKPTDSYSPALAKKLYEARDARNEKLLAEGGDAKLDGIDHTVNMISDYNYKLGFDSLPDASWGLPTRSENKDVPQDDQFYIDWLDHEIKLMQGEKETYQVPASYNELLKKFDHIASYYGGDDAKLSDSDYTRFGELPGFQDWDDITEYMVHLTEFPGKSEYDVKYYTPFLTDIINNWNQKHEQLQQEYAAISSKKDAQDNKSADNPETDNTTTVTSDAKVTTTNDTDEVKLVASPKNAVETATPVKTTAKIQNVVTTVAPKNATSKAVTLPQTGNSENSLVAELGLGLLALTVMFGLSKKRNF